MPQDLDDLIETASEEEGPPPPPEGGIPRQWLPGFIRWPVRYLFLPFLLLDLASQKIAKQIIRPPNIKVGKCLKRGNCCHYIMIPEAKGILGRLHFFWSTQINGFFLRDHEPYEYDNKRVHVMGCRYLKKDGRCGHYYLRPMVCRQWPLIEYFGKPRLLKGCGFKAVPRYSATKRSGLPIVK